jgi:hypothetical protein
LMKDYTNYKRNKNEILNFTPNPIYNVFTS